MAYKYIAKVWKKPEESFGGVNAAKSHRMAQTANNL